MDVILPSRFTRVLFEQTNLQGVWERSLPVFTVNIHISKVSIIMSFLGKMLIENAKKKEANNRDDEISEQSLQSHRTEENDAFM